MNITLHIDKKLCNRLPLLLFFWIPTLLISNAQQVDSIKFSVTAFYSSECPICKKSAQTLASLVQVYAPEKITFTLVFPGNFEKKKRVEKFCKDYRLAPNTEIVMDKNHHRVQRFNATVTPEFFLVNEKGEVLYSGALDDRFVKVGVQKPQAEKNFLKEAIDAALAGDEIKIIRTEPVGCFISK